MQEGGNTLAALNERVYGDDVCADKQRSSQEHCCIHGKALEENAGIESMMPGGRLVDALRLLWEIVKSPEGGRHDEYRVAWVRDAGLPAALFDSTLGSMAEPTSAKWQVPSSLITTPLLSSPDLLTSTSPLLPHHLGDLLTR